MTAIRRQAAEAGGHLAARPDDSWCEGPLATAMAPLGGLILYTGDRLDLQPTSRPQSGSRLMADREAMQAYAAGQPVPAVDAADIKAARELARRVDARRTIEGAIGIDLRLFVEICSPGANVPAIAFRSMLISLLLHLELLNPWLLGGDLEDAVYRVTADFPLAGIERFNLTEFLARLRSEPPRNAA